MKVLLLNIEKSQPSTIASLLETYVILTHIITGILGAIICILLTEIFNRCISHRLDKFCNYWWPKTFRRSISLSGKWKQGIYIESPNYDPIISSEVKLKQRFKNDTGTVIITNKNNNKVTSFIFGK